MSPEFGDKEIESIPEREEGHPIHDGANRTKP